MPMFSRERLVSARRARGLSQPALSTSAGVKVATLRAIEQGRVADPGGEIIARIASALGVPMESFFVEDEVAA